MHSFSAREPSGPAWNSPYRWIVAIRLLRARWINLISILGVTVGVASIIVVLAVMDGFQHDLRNLIRGPLPDVLVEFQVAPGISYDRMRSALLDLEGVEAVSLQRTTFGLIPAESAVDTDQGRQNLLPIKIVGIHPRHEREVSRFYDYLRDEEEQPADIFRLDPPPPFEESTPHVIVSRWIAKRVGYSHRGRSLVPGDFFGMISFEKAEEGQWEENDRDVVTSRIYDTQNSDYDKLHVYVDLNRSLHDFFKSEEGVTNALRVKLTDYDEAEAMLPRIERAIEQLSTHPTEIGKVKANTWEDRQRPLLAAVNNEKIILSFVLSFIVLVACFTIFATLTMTVVEKTREIGVLRAVGATAPGILSIFMLNGAFVGIIGAAMGYGAGLLIATNVNPIREFVRDKTGWDIFPADIYLFDYIPTYIDYDAAIYYGVGAAVCAVLFAIIPSVRAARLKPVAALRYE